MTPGRSSLGPILTLALLLSQIANASPLHDAKPPKNQLMIAPPPSKKAPSSTAPQRVLIFDAGSSGTRVYIYGWKLEKGKAVPEIFPEGPAENRWILKERVGLATFAEHPEKVADHLRPLIQFVKEKIGSAHKVPVYFYATGGVRRLHDRYEKILLDAVTDTLKKEAFLDVKEVLELTGQEEGTLSWVAVNALSKKFDNGQATDTLGIVELGGASLQIAFMPKIPSAKNGTTVTIGKHTYPIYAHSYDGIGREDAFERVKAAHHLSLCWLPETKPGPGAEHCIREIMDRLNLRSPNCDTVCAMQDVHQVPLEGEFVGIENFSHVANEHGNPHADLEFLNQLGDKVCSMSLSEHRKLYPTIPVDKALKACFDISFLRSILSGDGHDNGLGFHNGIKYQAITEINGIEPSWTYGAALLKIASQEMH